MKTTQLTIEGIELLIDYEWVDTSFDHAFGTKRQGQFEAVAISLASNKQDITALVSADICEKIDHLLNK